MTEIEKLTEKNKHLQETILAYSARVNMYELKVGRLRRNICKLMNDNEYKTCPDCCYDILDDEGDVMDHECISDNEMIAEFMGLDSFKDSLASLHQGKINVDVDVYEQAQYHTSWDWLMPVVEKIENGGLDPHELIDGSLRKNNQKRWRSIEDLYNVAVYLIKTHNKSNK